MLQPLVSTEHQSVSVQSTDSDLCSKFVQASVGQNVQCVQTISCEKKERQIQAKPSCKSVKIQTSKAAWCMNAKVQVKPITHSTGKSITFHAKHFISLFIITKSVRQREKNIQTSEYSVILLIISGSLQLLSTHVNLCHPFRTYLILKLKSMPLVIARTITH